MKKARAPSKPEATLELALRAATTFHYEQEYHWHPDRKFRADFAIFRSPFSQDLCEIPLLVEIDGASRFTKLGAHQRSAGVDYDCRRMAEALALGYQVLRVSAPMVYDGTALNYIERLMALRGGA